MSSLKFLAIAVLFVASSAAVSAQAASLSCLVGVYTAKDMTETTGTTTPTSTQVLTLPLDAEGAGDQEYQVNGETVALTTWKYEHTDLYNLTVLLTTPVADRAPRGPAMVAIISDYIFNDGPTKENGWDINPGPNATRFSFLNRQAGTFALTTKLVTALKTAGKWGTYPLNSTQIDVNNAISVVDFVKEQLEAKTMQETDVVGLSTMFSCTIEK